MHTALIPVAMQPRAEEWVWLLVVVGALVLVLLVLSVLRRRLLRPMPHRPTDTTDAWTEAGRRLQTPAPEAEADGRPGDEDTP